MDTHKLQRYFPREALEICQRLQQAGFQTVIVGGPVRDSLRGQKPEDIDLATAARPKQVQQLFNSTFTVGKGERHGTVGVQIGEADPMEVTTFRRDVHTDGRHARVEFTDNLHDDLKRRDFTINAMAFQPGPQQGELIDPFGGRRDLASKTLRAVGTPTERIQEDWLRVLRGYRFAGRFGLDIEPDTRAALRAGRQGLPQISIERIRDELLKMNRQTPRGEGRLEQILQIMDQDEVLSIILPGLEHTLRQQRQRAYRMVDLLEPDSLLRLSPLAVILTREGQNQDKDLGERLKLSNQQQKRLEQASQVLRKAPELDELESVDLRRLQHRHPGLELETMIELLYTRQRAREQGGRDEFEAARRQARQRADYIRRNNHPTQVEELAVDGEDILRELDLSPGPRVGHILDDLLQKVLQNPALNQRPRLLEHLRREYGPQPRTRS